VLKITTNGANHVQKILIAYDGSDASKRALDVAIDLAKKYDAYFEILSVIEELPKYAATVGEVKELQLEAQKHFHQLQQEAITKAAEVGVTLVDKVMPGHEVDIVVGYAEKHHFDLLVIGRHGHSAIRKKHPGSTSSNIVAHATCTILVLALGHDSKGSADLHRFSISKFYNP
jgi:nucleotide-binding universal stress UspA family protein